MSLRLEDSFSRVRGSNFGIEAKTHDLNPGNIFLPGETTLVLSSDAGETFELTLPDFLALAEYVLTNTDLVENDHRLQFLRCVGSMKQVSGWNKHQRPDCRRLEPTEPPYNVVARQAAAKTQVNGQKNQRRQGKKTKR